MNKKTLANIGKNRDVYFGLELLVNEGQTYLISL